MDLKSLRHSSILQEANRNWKEPDRRKETAPTFIGLICLYLNFEFHCPLLSLESGKARNFEILIVDSIFFAFAGWFEIKEIALQFQCNFTESVENELLWLSMPDSHMSITITVEIVLIFNQTDTTTVKIRKIGICLIRISSRNKHRIKFCTETIWRPKKQPHLHKKANSFQENPFLN